MDAARRALKPGGHDIADGQIGLASTHGQRGLVRGRDALAATGQNTAKGALGGGIIGGLAGLLTATGIVAIPGLAPLLAGGADFTRGGDRRVRHRRQRSGAVAVDS